MFDQYFFKPDTVDQIRGSWLGEGIERYVVSRSTQGYTSAHIRSTVPVLRRFAQFVWNRGGRTFEELPDHIEPFVTDWVAERTAGRSADRLRQLGNEIRGPVEQLVTLLVPSFVGRGRSRYVRNPFLTEAPGFFTYLREERGLRETSVLHYGHYLRVAWTYPSKKSLGSLKRKVRSWTTRSTTYLTLEQLLRHLNPMVRGWTTYFRYDAAKRTFAYVDSFVWWRVMRWLRKKHPKRSWRYLRKRYCDGRWDIRMGRLALFRPHTVKVERYRSRGQRILLPWMNPDDLGPVGFFARGPDDETVYLETLQQRLALD